MKHLRHNAKKTLFLLLAGCMLVQTACVTVPDSPIVINTENTFILSTEGTIIEFPEETTPKTTAVVSETPPPVLWADPPVTSETKVTEPDENCGKVIKRSVYGELLSGEYYFFRSRLSRDEKEVYDIIYEAVKEKRSTIHIEGKLKHNDSKMKTIYLSVVYDNPELIWLEAECSYTSVDGKIQNVFPVYNNLTTASAINAFEEATAPVINAAKQLNSPIQQVKYIHDHMIANIDFVENASYDQSAYSAAVLKESVCAGYAKLFLYYMQQLGIKSGIVTGTALDASSVWTSHAWNLIELDNEYYNIDVTWNDPITTSSGFRDYNYKYFNITDQEIFVDHARDDLSKYLPQAMGTKYSFANSFTSAEYGTHFT